MDCAEDGCSSAAAFQLRVPWGEDRVVCAGHARVESQKEGVVAQPLESADERLPDGAT